MIRLFDLFGVWMMVSLVVCLLVDVCLLVIGYVGFVWAIVLLWFFIVVCVVCICGNSRCYCFVCGLVDFWWLLRFDWFGVLLCAYSLCLLCLAGCCVCWFAWWVLTLFAWVIFRLVFWVFVCCIVDYLVVWCFGFDYCCSLLVCVCYFFVAWFDLACGFWLEVCYDMVTGWRFCRFVLF